MPIIDHRQFGQNKKTGRKKRWQRLVIDGAAAVLVLFVLVNIVMAVAYHNRVLPRYAVSGVSVGGVSYSKLHQRLQGNILPKQIHLQKNPANRSISPTRLGVSVDTAGSIADVKAARPALPIFSLFVRHNVPARVSIDTTTFTAATDELAPVFAKEPLMKRVIFNGTQFVIANPESGYKLDQNNLRRDLIAGLSRGQTHFAAPTTTVHPATASTDLQAEVQKLQKKLSLKISLAYNDKTIQPAAKDIGGWYVADFNILKLSPEKIGAYLDTVAPGAANRSDLILAVQYTLRQDQAATFAVAPKGSPVRTYCTATRGLSGADLASLNGKLAATYADQRGWGMNGRLAFQYVDSGCEYTVWLSAPSQMTSFGDICDDFYNCQVGTNVIVNDDRWNKSTDPWLGSGGSIEDYRTLVINHETGHRLGFYDNYDCPVPGGPAPVMMQQSIDLHGCTFNRFPTATELSELAAKIGL